MEFEFFVLTFDVQNFFFNFFKFLDGYCSSFASFVILPYFILLYVNYITLCLFYPISFIIFPESCNGVTQSAYFNPYLLNLLLLPPDSSRYFIVLTIPKAAKAPLWRRNLQAPPLLKEPSDIFVSCPVWFLPPLTSFFSILFKNYTQQGGRKFSIQDKKLKLLLMKYIAIAVGFKNNPLFKDF